MELARCTGTPIAATSANQSGKASPFTVQEAVRELGNSAKYVVLIVNHGRTPHSTLLDLTQNPSSVLRKRPMTRGMLLSIFT